MQINNSLDLREAILVLKQKEAEEKSLLTQQWHLTAESLKPVNIIKNAFRRISGTQVADSVLDAAVGVGAGILSKKILLGKSTNLFKKIIGNVLEVGVANVVAGNNPGRLFSKGMKLFKLFSGHNKEQN
jgi:hypothetical protein